MQNVIFHLVLTNQCNKRCEYCDLDFKNNIISKNDIDLFIKYINTSVDKFWEIRINFFWWEPLLEFETIEYVLENIKSKNVLYSIWTNWILLTQEKYYILKQYTVEINYSIDTETFTSILQQDYLDFSDSNFYINFILNPNTIDYSFPILEIIHELWIKNINILPVYATIDWNKNSLILLNKIINILWDKKNMNINGLSYYERPTSDIEYIIETNGNIYQDIHTHLWFLKQYEIIPQEMKVMIEKGSYIGSLETISKDLLEIQFCKLKYLYKISLEIPRKQWFQRNFIIIDKILQKLKN
jgi:sulfatase maturation enzyme AslB (radical SAM superfamily)